jgi:hypothetical protein
MDLDRSALKLLVPEDTEVDQWDLRVTGRGKVKDWQRQATGGRRVRLTGQISRGEVRVVRGGVAVLHAMMSREFVEDCRRAHRECSTPTVHDPA